MSSPNVSAPVAYSRSRSQVYGSPITRVTGTSARAMGTLMVSAARRRRSSRTRSASARAMESRRAAESAAMLSRRATGFCDPAPVTVIAPAKTTATPQPNHGTERFSASSRERTGRTYPWVRRLVRAES